MLTLLFNYKLYPYPVCLRYAYVYINTLSFVHSSVCLIPRSSTHIITPPLNSQVMYMYETDLAFYDSYKDGTRASRELHQAYETYIKAMTPKGCSMTRVKVSSSDAIIS